MNRKPGLSVCLLALPIALVGLGPLIFAPVFASGQEDADRSLDPAIIGHWKGVADNQEIDMVLKYDGSALVNAVETRYRTPHVGYIVMVIDGTDMHYNYKVTGLELRVIGEEMEGVAVFSRVDLPTGVRIPLRAEDIAGTWVTRRQGKTITLVFEESGVAKMGDRVWDFSVSEDKLELIADGNKTTYVLEMSGGLLTVSEGDLEIPLTFGRAAGEGPKP